MRRFIFLLAFLLCTTTAFSEEEATQETSDETTAALENSTNETLANVQKNAEDQTSAEAAEENAKPRSKWDFSDHFEDKKTPAKTEKSSSKYKTNSLNTVKTLKDNKSTWKSPVSGKVSQSTYAN